MTMPTLTEMLTGRLEAAERALRGRELTAADALVLHRAIDSLRETLHLTERGRPRVPDFEPIPHGLTENEVDRLLRQHFDTILRRPGLHLSGLSIDHMTDDYILTVTIRKAK